MTRSIRWLIVGVLVATAWTAAADWPQWRGPERDGVAAGFEAPEPWPAAWSPAWRQEVGVGHSSPVVAGERVFLHSREGEEETVRALSLTDGRTLWKSSYPAPYQVHSAASDHGPGPKSTPVLAGGRLVTLGISGILSAFDAASGELLWRHDLSGRFPRTSPAFGTAASPLVVDGKVITHLGGHHDGVLAAFDLATGKTLWELPGDGPGYASPMLVDAAGIRQVVTQTDQHVVGVALADGRLLWQLPFSTPYSQNAVTPLVVGDLVIVSGLEQGVAAYRLAEREGFVIPRRVWHTTEIGFYMSSPVLLGGRLWGMAHQKAGQLVALDPETGSVLWTGEGRLGDNAALVAADGHLLVLTDGADLLVLAPGKDGAPREVARHEVAPTPTWAHPVPTRAGLLIKDEDHLALLAPRAPKPETQEEGTR